MGIINSQIRTATCNTCGVTASFEVTRHGVKNEVIEQFPWLKTGREILTTDGRPFFYCSDTCEVKGVETGQHNIPEPKKVIEQGNDAAVKAAAASAAAAESATRAIKSGQGGPVVLG